MSAIWLCVIAVGAATVALKAAGPKQDPDVEAFLAARQRPALVHEQLGLEQAPHGSAAKRAGRGQRHRRVAGV